MSERKLQLSTPISRASSRFLLVLTGLSLLFANAQLAADEPAWIWSPQTASIAGSKPSGTCYFRKKFTLVGPEQAELQFRAADEYEIYVNGRLAARGQSFGKLIQVDVSELIEPGVNLLAARVRHLQSDQVGLSLKFRVKEAGDVRWRSLATDASWRTRRTEFANWNQNTYNDMAWIQARALPRKDAATVAGADKADPSRGPNQSVKSRLSGELPQIIAGASPARGPAADRLSAVVRTNPTTDATPSPAPASTADPGDRFQVVSGFDVQQIMSDDETGSLIAMAFNEFGKLLVSRERGGLMIADLSAKPGSPGRIREYCSEVSSCQGILPLNGSVYVTGMGPQGMGLYRIADSDGDGTATVQQRLLAFSGQPGEHGPHGIRLGQDGMLYVVIGNASQVTAEIESNSPIVNLIEGDLVPRFEDPGGHAQGVKVPGGTVVRVSLDGKRVERFAAGIRNAYDLVFDAWGELFIHDSDMESDRGTTWYRPTTIFHVPAGSEIGWRSGWAKFPQHFPDQTPALAMTGRGSPSGATLYQHFQFPRKYHESLFFADWSEGRILSVKPQRSGAGYQGKPEVFLTGRPLNVCDLAVGEDGSLYFCTGGRGTAGGVFRVRYRDEIPSSLVKFDTEMAKAIRHPQPDSAWARQNIAQIRIKLGQQWDTELVRVAGQVGTANDDRIRALQLMLLHGPQPTASLLSKLVTDPSPEIRAQAARICGLPSIDAGSRLLPKLLADSNPYVRRVACESCLRQQIAPSINELAPLLASLDRSETQAARRLLEWMPIDTWQDAVLKHDNPRVFMQGSMAMLTAAPSLQRSYLVLARSAEMVDGYLSDRDFVELLRVMQMAVVEGEVDPQKVPGLTARIANEFPSKSSLINRELARLMGYLKAGQFNGRLEAYFANDQISNADMVHVAMYLTFAFDQLASPERLAVLDALETARANRAEGGSYDGYVQQALDSVARRVVASDLETVLENGHRWPKTALVAFYQLPQQIDPATETIVIGLDQKLRAADSTDPACQQVRLGVIAILARDGSEACMGYLRQLWQDEPDRRNDIVIGLAQQPSGENWPYLISSLSSLDDLTGIETMRTLIQVPRRPQEPQYFRQVVELGYRLRGQGARVAADLMEHWTGEQPESETDDWTARLDHWKAWHAREYPDDSPIQMPPIKVVGRHSTAAIMEYLETSGLGDSHRGQAIFERAQCATCHRVNDLGETMGPDLSGLASRFSIREIVESTIEPSANIPDRYASESVLTVDGLTLHGMTIRHADESISVLQSNGQRIRVPADEIEAMQPSAASAMPENLLDSLSQQEIADLVAWLVAPSRVASGGSSGAPATSGAANR